MTITHRQLAVFRAVMMTGHVTRAAEQLHSSQPTVSRELARLEQVLGLVLFDRVKGRLQPTARALALLEEVEQSFVGLERIAATAAALREFAQGRLLLSCQPALAHALLPQALARFKDKQPQASVVVSTQESPGLEAALTEQRFDLGLTERHEAPVATTLETLLTANEVVVLPPGHALAAKPVLSLSDFAQQDFISLAAGDPYRQQMDALFAQAGVQRQLRLESPSAVSVCAMVRHGLGLAIVNPLTALELSVTGLLVRPLAVAIPFHVALVMPSWRAVHPLRDDLVAALREAAESLRQALLALPMQGG